MMVGNNYWFIAAVKYDQGVIDQYEYESNDTFYDSCTAEITINDDEVILRLGEDVGDNGPIYDTLRQNDHDRSDTEAYTLETCRYDLDSDSLVDL